MLPLKLLGGGGLGTGATAVLALAGGLALKMAISGIEEKGALAEREASREDAAEVREDVGAGRATLAAEILADRSRMDSIPPPTAGDGEAVEVRDLDDYLAEEAAGP